MRFIALDPNYYDSDTKRPLFYVDADKIVALFRIVKEQRKQYEYTEVHFGQEFAFCCKETPEEIMHKIRIALDR